jgi:hypothetical protein
MDAEDHRTEQWPIQNRWKLTKSRRPDSNRGPLHYENYPDVARRGVQTEKVSLSGIFERIRNARCGVEWCGVCLHFVRTPEGCERKRLADVAVEQMHVRRERERRGVMPKPALHLHRIAELSEQHRSARVPKRMKAHPRHAGLLSRGLQ